MRREAVEVAGPSRPTNGRLRVARARIAVLRVRHRGLAAVGGVHRAGVHRGRRATVAGRDDRGVVARIRSGARVAVAATELAGDEGDDPIAMIAMIVLR